MLPSLSSGPGPTSSWIRSWVGVEHFPPIHAQITTMRARARERKREQVGRGRTQSHLRVKQLWLVRDLESGLRLLFLELNTRGRAEAEGRGLPRGRPLGF